jgi:hypothetical protein
VVEVESGAVWPPARVLLESIQAENAGRRGGEKFLSREDTEAEIVRRLDTYGEAELNRSLA